MIRISFGVPRLNNEADVNHCVRCKFETAYLEIGKLYNNIDVCSIEGKQSDLCKSNIIVSHADCFCLQEKKEDEARSILRSHYFDDRLSNQLILGSLGVQQVVCEVSCWYKNVDPAFLNFSQNSLFCSNNK